MYRIATSSPSPTGQPPVDAATSFEGISPRDRAESLGRQGWACQQREQLAEALEHYRSALSLLDSAENRPLWRLIVPLKNNMATILRAKGHLREAEGYYIQAINMMEECDTPPWGKELADLYANLATLYISANMPEASVRMQEQSLRILEGARPPGTLMDHLKCLRQLEGFYRRAGMSDAAAQCSARFAAVAQSPVSALS